MAETATHRKWRIESLQRVITRLRKLVKTHEIVSVWLIMATHFIMVALDLGDRATYQTVVLDDLPLLKSWAESGLWIILGVVCLTILAVFRRPPRLIWGLWLSTGTMAGWGIVNLTVGLRAEPQVSLLGPTVILFVIAPLALATANSIQERMQHDLTSQGQADTASRHRAGG